ncbi:ATP-dependent 6-phosphofructokinase [Glaciecola petra]|uniref:6-phosphofructokinase n=1 Tax=Glaciecola petra TaxID=3075602 RepID=A0ABU2ZPU5_9ALTE|nr:ATP-dependent 6-phosphofructokinase [Aestuariibacter sp. P117]MDT0594425.1 ATP-dependent 6-phosphofructokinase [Aestuariibacter sp. P117]
MTIKKIAIITSGGDAPGMNACIRSICLSCESEGIEVVGYRSGYIGLLKKESIPLHTSLVQNLLQRGGTILHSARCEKFRKDQYVKQAAKNLDDEEIDGLIVIGGNGSFKGAQKLQYYWDKPVIGVPGTIDNDIAGTDYTIGYHTAIQTAVESLDKVRDTAEAFERIFLVDVMGREAGFIALNSAISSGADHVVLPETFTSAAEEVMKILDKLSKRRLHHKNSSHIIVVTENIWPGGLNILQQSLEKETGVDVRILTLGHVQRGGSPVWQDRLLATKLGTHAVHEMIKGKKGVMAGIKAAIPVSIAFDQIDSESKKLNPFSMQMLESLMLLG